MIQILFNGFTPQYNAVELIGNIGDNIAEKVYFIFDKNIDGIELTDLRVTLSILSAEETGDVILLYPTVLGDKVSYEWEIKNNATAVKGKLQWQLNFYNAQTGYVKNTNVCKFKIGDSINIEEVIDVTPSLFQQLVQECMKEADRSQAAADESEASAEASKGYSEESKGYSEESKGYADESKGYSEEAKETLEEIKELKTDVEEKVEEASELLEEVKENAETVATHLEEVTGLRDEVAELAEQVTENKEAVDTALEEIKEIQEDVATKHTEVTEMKDQVAEDTEEVDKAKEQVRADRNTVLTAMTTMELIREDVEANAEESKDLLEQTQGQADNAKSSADAAAESAKRAAETAAGLDAFFIRKYDKLPEVGEERTMYLIPSESPDGNNYFDEYIWFPETGYEYIGNTKLNLDDYATEEDLSNKITMETAEASTPMDLVFKVTSRNIVYNTTIKVSPYMGIRIVE